MKFVTAILFALLDIGAAAQSSPAPAGKVITQQDCTAEKLGTSIPPNLIGEPVSSVTLSPPGMARRFRRYSSILQRSGLHDADRSEPVGAADSIRSSDARILEPPIEPARRRRNERIDSDADGRSGRRGQPSLLQHGLPPTAATLATRADSAAAAPRIHRLQMLDRTHGLPMTKPSRTSATCN